MDLRGYDFRLEAINGKEESLLRVRSALAGDGPKDATEFLRDIVIGANFGWVQGSAQRATFNDLLGSGRLGVIGDPDVRALVVAYYESYETANARIDERETAYPHISYQLVPRSHTPKHQGDVGGVGERDVESGLSDEYLDELVNAVHESAIGNHVIAEINLARFIRGMTKDLQAQAEELVAKLKEYRTEIE